MQQSASFVSAHFERKRQTVDMGNGFNLTFKCFQVEVGPEELVPDNRAGERSGVRHVRVAFFFRGCIEKRE